MDYRNIITMEPGKRAGNPRNHSTEGSAIGQENDDD